MIRAVQCKNSVEKETGGGVEWMPDGCWSIYCISRVKGDFCFYAMMLRGLKTRHSDVGAVMMRDKTCDPSKT
jgi:hypothetical protein